ncbi:AI-2E family transporter [Algibacter mikhailovii]|uniref:AI-2E family transporter n=1 Tax=Algibacter mikhailovii TaxID=425498 RepID=A0A918RDF4_9FLAO|nr:AI-2E family transporter [Algibacter mikhailovii]GGZ92682.1 AI-2E family transporter [Algibacter mikhailovii]
MKPLKSNPEIDTFIKIIVLSILIIWSFYIVEPFVLLLMWSVIVAVALNPLYIKVTMLLKGKKKGLLGSLFIVLLVGLILIPTISITESIVESSTMLYQNFDNGTLKIPPPNASVNDWPLIGKKIYGLWSNASRDIESFIMNHPDEIKSSLGWFFDSVKGLVGVILLSIVALIVAGVFMASADDGYKTGVKFMNKLKEGQGEGLMNMCISTIRSVVKGILLVAVIQGILAFAGFSMIGLDATAGLLSIVVIFAAIIQVPVLLVVLPAIIYVFSFAETTPAVIFAIYMVVVSLLDNVLKPMLLAKGLQTPMILILIGAIGGMIFQGILGLFIGPVVLAIVHNLYSNWVNNTEIT